MFLLPYSFPPILHFTSIQYRWMKNSLSSQSPPQVSSQLDSSKEEATPSRTVGGPSNTSLSPVSPHGSSTGPSTFAAGTSNHSTGPSNHTTGPGNHTTGPGNHITGPGNHITGPGNIVSSMQMGAERFQNHHDSHGTMGEVRKSQSMEAEEASVPCGRATYLTMRDKNRHRLTNRKEAHLRNPLQWSHGNRMSSAQFSRYGNRHRHIQIVGIRKDCSIS